MSMNDYSNPIMQLLTTQTISANDVKAYDYEDDFVAKVVAGEEFIQRVIEYRKNPIFKRGATLPWGATFSNIRFRPKETSVWAGINGHGKSMLLGMAALKFMAQRQKVLIVSLEMPPEATLDRMINQFAMNSDAPESFITGRFRDFMTDRLYIFDHVGNMNPRMLYATIRYAALERKVDHIIVDSMMKVVSGSDDYNGQKEFMNNITRLAQQLNVHIHVVHHVKKMESEEVMPNKFDLKGDSSVTDMPDQVLVVYRNRRKEKALRKNPHDDAAQAAEDTVLSVEKNRHGGWEGHIKLWFNPACSQYLSNSKRIPIDLTEDDL